MPNYYSAVTKVINYIQSSCTHHVEVKSFGQGELDDHSITGSDLYPMCFLEYPLLATYTERMIEWKVVLIVKTIENRDRSDEVYLLGYTFDILNDLLEKFRQEEPDYILKDDSINILSLTEYSDDYCVGWRCEFQMDQAIPMDRCNIDDRFN